MSANDDICHTIHEPPEYGGGKGWTFDHHTEECQGDEMCDIAKAEAEEHVERMVAEFRAEIVIRSTPNRDGENTPFCTGCHNGCSYCEEA